MEATYGEVALKAPGRSEAIAFLAREGAIKYREDPPTGARTKQTGKKVPRTALPAEIVSQWVHINSDGSTIANRPSC